MPTLKQPLTPSVHSRVFLVSLTIKTWSAQKYDKSVAKNVAKQSNTTDAGRFNKFLLPLNQELVNIKKVSTEVRNFFYENTLPWTHKGYSLLPSKNYFNFEQQYQAMRNVWEGHVTNFLNAYPGYTAQAQSTLGALYDVNDYPTLSQLKTKFKMELDLGPTPQPDFFIEGCEDIIDSIRDDVRRNLEKAHKNAMQSLWNKLQGEVTHMQERLSDPKAKFHNSLVENLVKFCDMLPALNYAEDPELTAMGEEVRKHLTQITPDTLRNDMNSRKQVAQKAGKILSDIAPYTDSINPESQNDEEDFDNVH